MSDQEGDGKSKVTRLPRRPRRMTEGSGERPDKTWHPDGGSVHDSAPTRPVLRSELQCETGRWQVDQDAAPQSASSGTERGGNVIDLNASRRKRAGDAAPAAGIRRLAGPRRIEPETEERSGDTPDSP